MLLFYNGRSPVNVFYLFFFFVLLQMIGTFALFFTFGFFNKNPIFKFLKNIFLRILKSLGVMDEILTDELVRKEFLINGVFFSLGGILAIIIKVFFSDVVFGWSSSVNINSDEIKKAVDVISLPWKYFWNEAVPSLKLIEDSHYFRVNSKFFLEEIRSLQQIKALGQWWQFFVACILFYGILPRLVFWIYEVFKPSDLKRMRKSLFKFDSDQVLDLFKFNRDETKLFHSIINLLIENDIKLEKDPALKIHKEKWRDNYLFEYKSNHGEKNYTFDEVTNIVRNSVSENNHRCLIMFCEVLTFETYSDLRVKDLKFKEKEGVKYLEKLLSFNGSNSKYISKYFERLKFNIKENTPKNLLQKWFGVALIGGAAIALTGGVGLAAAKILGVVTIAARTAGFLKLGGGLLNVLGFEEEKNMIVMGAGNILGGLKESFDEAIYEKYLKSESVVLRDLGKLETYIEYKFFDSLVFDKVSKSLEKHLKELKEDLDSLDVSHKNHLVTYINKLLNYL